MSQPVDLYFANTPNGWKIEIFFEEAGIPYKIHYIDIGKGDQFKPEFLKISPNNKIPAVVDHSVKTESGDSLSIFESGAILIYYAQKIGKFLPDPKTDPIGYADVLQWVMWQMGGLGPMVGQFNHFQNYALEKVEYGINRYKNEALRLLKVLDTRLANQQFISKSGFGWILHTVERNQIEVPENVMRWYREVSERPAVKPLAEKYVKLTSKPKVYSVEETKVLHYFGNK